MEFLDTLFRGEGLVSFGRIFSGGVSIQKVEHVGVNDVGF